MAQLHFKPNSDKVQDQYSEIPNLNCFFSSGGKKDTGVWYDGRETCLLTLPLRAPLQALSISQGCLTSLSFPQGAPSRLPQPSHSLSLWLVVAPSRRWEPRQDDSTRGASCITKSSANPTGSYQLNNWMPTVGWEAAGLMTAWSFSLFLLPSALRHRLPFPISEALTLDS